MFRLENIYYAYAFILVPVFILVYVLVKRWRKKAIQQFGSPKVVNSLMPEVSVNKPLLKFILLIVGLFFLIVGIVNPQWGSKLQEVKRQGADIMIALDVSNSMKAEDISPNRLERAKQSIAKLLDKLEGDRIGIVVFAGDAYVQLPITTDYAAAKLFLENIDTDIVPTQGTAIGSAIRLCVESFGKDVGKNKAIVIITDGENHEDDANTAAQEAVEQNISVHTIGMGSVQGSPIPIYKGGVQAGYRKDKEGNTVITKLDEGMLQEIARNGNGAYVRATNSDTGLNAIIDEINKLEKKEFESKMFTDYESYYDLFIAIALLLIVIELFFSERKSKLAEQINIFGRAK